jgi:hypothetical protein
MDGGEMVWWVFLWWVVSSRRCEFDPYGTLRALSDPATPAAEGLFRVLQVA